MSSSYALGTGTASNALYLSTAGFVGAAQSNPQYPLDVLGNANVSGTVAAGTGTMFRNRIINGDMRFDSTYSGSNMQTGNVAASAASTVTSLDQFKLASGPASSILAAKQITLTAADQLAVGNISSKAVAISPTVAPDPTLGLTTLITFDGSNAVDTLGGVTGPTLVGTSPVAYTTGKMGSTCFDMTTNPTAGGGTVNLALQYSVSSFTPNSNSFSFWVNPATTTGLGYIVLGTGNSSSSFSVELILNYASAGVYGVMLQVQSGSSWYYSPSSTLALQPQISSNVWTHIAVTTNGSALMLYVNGSASSGTYSSPNAITTINIGQRVGGAAGVSAYKGYIDDFRIYNRVLTQQDVTALYNYGNAIPMAVTSTLNTGLMAYIPFEGGSVQDVLGALTAPTWTGSPAFATGKVGSTALYMNNGANVTAQTKASNQIAYTGIIPPYLSHTMAFWVNMTQITTGFSFILGFGSTSTSTDCAGIGWSGGSWSYFLGSANVSTTYTFTPTANTWYHVALQYVPGTSATIFFNGVQVSQRTTSVPANLNVSGVFFNIGDNYISGAIQPFAGYIDDFRLYNRVLSAAEVATLAANTPVVPISNTLAVPQVATTTSLVSYYPFEPSAAPTSGLTTLVTFEGSSGSDTLSSLTGPTTAGTVTYSSSAQIGSVCMAVANTAGGSATNYLMYGVPSTLNFPTAATISFWMYPTSVPASTGQASPMGFNNGAGTPGPYFFIHNNSDVAGQFSWTGYTSTGTTFSIDTSSGFISINKWYHVAGVVNGTSLSLYMNGVLTGTTTIAGTPSLSTRAAITNLALGSLYSTGGGFAGSVDDFRIYNRALSANEVAQLAGCLYDLQGAYPLTPTGTVQYVGGQVGSQALYLANEGNVSANSKSPNYVQFSSYTNTASVSVSCWFYMTSFNSSNNSGSCVWAFGPTSGDYLALAVYPKGISVYAGSNTHFMPAVAGTWYHAVAVWTPSTSASLYVNGVLISTTTSSIVSSLSNYIFRIGDATSSTIAPFAGYVDDLRIYSRALSAADAAGLYYVGQNTGYVLYQQPIQGQALVDLGWGTTGAQSATLSTWIKNNSATAQQYTMSLTSANTAGLTTWIPFEGGSAADVMGGVTGPAVTGTLALSSSIYKVGSSALNLTANTANGTALSRLTYNNISLPSSFSVSFWVNPSTIGVSYQIMVAITAPGAPYGYGINLNSTGAFIDAYISSANSTDAITTSIAIPANTWTHIVTTMSATPTTSGYNSMYINGVLGSSVAIGSGYLVGNSTSTAVSRLTIGSYYDNTTAFKGYIDDLRIYNTALTQAQVYQLYINNANTTTLTPYLIPRSLVYTTPSIPSAAWQKIALTVPGDTLGTYANDATNSLTVSLCLGAGTGVSTSNVAAASGNALSVWNNGLYYAASNVQTYGASTSNFMASPYNSVYMTGLQLEKGTMVTPFEYRPVNIEGVMNAYTGLGVPTKVIFTSGTSTWTAPTGVTAVQIQMVGGGGSGGAPSSGVYGSSGGGAGAYIECILTGMTTAYTILSFSVGLGGSSVTGSSAGNAGGATTITGGSGANALSLSAGGGSGGVYNSCGGGSGGTCTVTQPTSGTLQSLIQVSGSWGGGGDPTGQNGNSAPGGVGGTSYFGGAGTGGIYGGTKSAVGYGSGGGGAGGGDAQSGAGYGGVIIITYFSASGLPAQYTTAAPLALNGTALSLNYDSSIILNGGQLSAKSGNWLLGSWSTTSTVGTEQVFTLSQTKANGNITCSSSAINFPAGTFLITVGGNVQATVNGTCAVYLAVGATTSSMTTLANSATIGQYRGYGSYPGFNPVGISTAYTSATSFVMSIVGYNIYNGATSPVITSSSTYGSVALTSSIGTFFVQQLL